MSTWQALAELAAGETGGKVGQATGARHDAASPRAGAASLADVARLAGVSEATASRVLARSRRVRPELAVRVLDAAAKLDYAPNPHARALARSEDASVGVVVHDLTDPYFSEIVRGVLLGAEASDRMVVVCSTLRDPERELDYVRRFRAQRVHAVLLAGSGRLDRAFGARLGAELLGFERAGGRTVLIGRHDLAGDCVRPDNSGGARLVARHLAGLGHERIAVIAGPAGLTTSQDRLSGFRAELERLGRQLSPELVVEGDFSRDGGARAMEALLATASGFSAVFAANDLMAIGALASLRQHGVEVPGECSVVGFGDVPFARDTVPALTTVAVPMVEVGRRAFVLATQPAAESSRAERLPTKLVVRASAAPPGRRGERPAG